VTSGRSPTSRRAFLKATGISAAGIASGGVVKAAVAADGWRPRWILSSAMYGSFPLAEIVPEVAKTNADMIDLWPKPHGTQREEVDSLGEATVREMLAAAGIRLGGRRRLASGIRRDA
jgi:hypothetical protein